MINQGPFVMALLFFSSASIVCLFKKRWVAIFSLKTTDELYVSRRLKEDWFVWQCNFIGIVSTIPTIVLIVVAVRDVIELQ